MYIFPNFCAALPPPCSSMAGASKGRRAEAAVADDRDTLNNRRLEGAFFKHA